VRSIHIRTLSTPLSFELSTPLWPYVYCHYY
jgi:hypothetical protein